jgi:hypothetical protein
VPLIQAKANEGVLDLEREKRIIDGAADARAGGEGEATHPLTRVFVEEGRGGERGIGGGEMTIDAKRVLAEVGR